MNRMGAMIHAIATSTAKPIELQQPRYHAGFGPAESAGTFS
jgi:hypothetical protein